MMPELGGPGAWARACTGPDRTRFDAPTVEGVDHPSLGLCAARNDPEAGELHVLPVSLRPVVVVP